jgi:hypothetical protein
MNNIDAFSGNFEDHRWRGFGKWKIRWKRNWGKKLNFGMMKKRKGNELFFQILKKWYNDVWRYGMKRENIVLKNIYCGCCKWWKESFEEMRKNGSSSQCCQSHF